MKQHCTPHISIKRFLLSFLLFPVEILKVKYALANLNQTIHMNQVALVERLESLAVLGVKIQDETVTLTETVADLRAALEASETLSPEVVAALEAVESQLAVVDALVPDLEVVVDPAPEVVVDEPVVE